MLTNQSRSDPTHGHRRDGLKPSAEEENHRHGAEGAAGGGGGGGAGGAEQAGEGEENQDGSRGEGQASRRTVVSGIF